MRHKLVLSLAGLSLSVAAFAQPFDGLTTQQREWRATAQFYDNWMSDIRNRGGSGSNAGRGMQDYAAQIAQSQSTWAAGAAERNAARLREQERMRETARREAAQQSQDAVETARRLAESAARSARNYQSFLGSGGHGTKEMPPHFYDDAQAFQWYLKQAEAGDPYAAFYVGRTYALGGNDAQAAQWLAKSNLSYPKAAALYGSLLLRGAGVARDEARGRPMLEKAAAEDASGYAAWLYATLLRDGNGVTVDVVNSALYLGQAIVMAEQPSMLEGIDVLAPWDERMWERLSRRSRMRDELKELAAQQPEPYVAAMEAASRQKRSDIYGVLGGAVGEMKPEPARTVYLAWLKLTESRPTVWGYWGRAGAISGLVSKRHPDAAAHYLLPDTFNRTANSFIPHSDEQANKLWETHAATIENWSRESSDLAPRAARALVARDMGRWPKVSSRQPARAVLEKLRALKVANPHDVLAGEVLDGVFTGNPQWSDKTKAVQWLDELGALDAGFKDLRELYLKAPSLEGRFAHTLDPIVLALRDAQSGRQEFTAAQLDTAEAERNAAVRLLFSDPQAAFDGLLKALKGGDALAGWQLLIMADGKFLSILKQRPFLLALTDQRLQRDVKGTDDRAATAALALHFLHRPDAVGRGWQRGWRVTPSLSVDWLQLAEQKGHPWAVFHSAGGYDAANKARNRNDPEAQKIWPWLAQNYDVLSKTELWRRDVQLLELFPMEREIEFLQQPLRAVELARSEAARFADITARLESAREILAAYDKDPAALDEVQAKALYEHSRYLAQLDSDTGVLLPRHLVQRLELLVQASILGDEYAAREVGSLLKAPGFPFEPHPAEAQHWLDVGQGRLRKIAEQGERGAAMDAAHLLAMEFKSGQTFARDYAQSIKYLTLAATLGHQRSASALSNAYRFGELDVTKDAAQHQKWQNLAEAIAMGRYEVPAAALAGRPKKGT